MLGSWPEGESQTEAWGFSVLLLTPPLPSRLVFWFKWLTRSSGIFVCSVHTVTPVGRFPLWLRVDLVSSAQFLQVILLKFWKPRSVYEQREKLGWAQEIQALASATALIRMVTLNSPLKPSCFLCLYLSMKWVPGWLLSLLFYPIHHKYKAYLYLLLIFSSLNS